MAVAVTLDKALDKAEKLIELAQRIQSKLLTIRRAANGGVHHANFRVLRLANYPAVLVECGYLSNRSEGREAHFSCVL